MNKTAVAVILFLWLVWIGMILAAILERFYIAKLRRFIRTCLIAWRLRKHGWHRHYSYRLAWETAKKLTQET